MTVTFAAMSGWMGSVLIVFSCLSLIIALYCLFFMVPFRRFMERIRSLGGGLEGIEAHVDGVRDEIQTRLTDLEEGTRQQLAEQREAAEQAVEESASEGQEVRREVEMLRKDVQSLQAELRQSAADTVKVSQTCEALGKRLQQLLNDFDALDVELRESVRHLVAESLSTVESTVLSALDAVQEEILYGTGESEPGEKPHPRRPAGPRPSPGLSGPGAGRSRDNIIQMEPLFARLQSDEEEEAGESEEEEGEGDESPSEPTEGGDRRP